MGFFAELRILISKRLFWWLGCQIRVEQDIRLCVGSYMDTLFGQIAKIPGSIVLSLSSLSVNFSDSADLLYLY